MSSFFGSNFFGINIFEVVMALAMNLCVAPWSTNIAELARLYKGSCVRVDLRGRHGAIRLITLLLGFGVGFGVGI